MDTGGDGGGRPGGSGREGRRLGAGRERLIRLLLRIYPAGFRREYGEEMVDTVREQWAVGRAPRLGRLVLNIVVEGLRVRLEWRVLRVTQTGRTQAPYAARSGPMDRLRQDIEYALRFLRRSPAFTVIVLLTLSLGIGMNTAVFSVLYGVVYRPLPFHEPDELVQIGRTHPDIPNVLLPISPGMLVDIRERVQTLVSLEAETPRAVVLTRGSEASRHGAGVVTAGLLETLGVRPALGRVFLPGEDEPGSTGVVVLSDGFWRSVLGGDPSVLNSTIRLDDAPYTVVGIMPPEFNFLRAELWIPFVWTDSNRTFRQGNFLRMFARLNPGVDATQASAELARIWAPLREEFPLGNERTEMAAQRLGDIVAQLNRRPLLILSGAAAFVLLIACANVANLLLVRAEQRQREVGVRAALGAGRGRLIRQFLTEGILISLIGGLAGIAIGWAGVRVLLATFSNSVARSQDIGIHPPVLLFTLAASVVTGLLIGVLPALRAREDFDVLREGARGGTSRFTMFGKALVVAEIALALMLVTGAGLLLKSYAKATGAQLGFDPQGMVAASLWFPPSRYADGSATFAFTEQLREQLRARAEVTNTAMASQVPIRESGNNFTSIGVVGTDATASFVENRFVTPDYFGTLGIRLVGGRLNTDDDARNQSSVVVIGRTLARTLFGDGDPVGHRLDISPTFQPEIIGVVEDIRESRPDLPPRPVMYRPLNFASNLLVKTTRDVAGTTALLRETARAIDPAVSVVRVQSMTEIVDASLSGRRFQLTLIGVFAVTALLLACIGIYGVLSYTVTRQSREIGVRMALGAHAAAVATQVAWRGGRLALAGVAFGMGGALLLRTTIETQLFEVETFDPMVYFGVAAVLLTVATAACFLPARRAALVQPTQALRIE